MLLRLLLLLIYVLRASATYIFRHDPAGIESSVSDGTLSASDSRHDGRGGRRNRGHPGKRGNDKQTISAPTPTGTPCSGNTPDDRSTWCDYDISTDYWTTIPDTGVTREYWFDIDETTVAPDGYARPAMAINGSIPGPTIYADWGDTVVVHVTNHLQESQNGTSIHWHGIRQNHTNQHDGVVSITQCPVAPGDSLTYRWRATQYGTAWYHSHIGLQAWEGVAGGMVINGPATANYDEDKGPILLMDWSHETADELFIVAQTEGPPTLSNALINGTNMYGTDDNATGRRFTMKADEGSSYRLRIINGALNTHFKFMIDNHTLTVISMDLVPIKPYTTDVVSIAMGQRYDVIVTANQASFGDSFWLRAIPQQACSDNESTDNVKGILHYSDTASTPTTTAFPFDDNCNDEPLSKLIPYVPKPVESPNWQSITDVTLNRNPQNLLRWYLNSTTMQVRWEDQTLLQIAHDETVFAQSSAVIELPNPNEWVYLVINTTIPVAHPIHLHGHDFVVLAHGTNPWDGSVNTRNPPRRDTAVLPGNGYLVIAFLTDNPGAWLMHCHIGWHMTEAFALQFVERHNEILGLIDQRLLERTCNVWNRYDEEHGIEQEDSGV